MFAQYVHLYYDYAVSSVYLIDTDGKGFNGCFLVNKKLNDAKEVKEAVWDAIHVVTCEVAGSKVTYTVISTVLISVHASTETLGKMTIAGSCSKTSKSEVTGSAEFTSDPDQFHLRQIGQIIETNEDALRLEVAENYTSKQRQITNTGRLMDEYRDTVDKQKFRDELAQVTAKIAQTRVD